jgi:SNF family Na+-dependent transporter
MSETVHPHQQASSLWTSRMAFVLAAAGSAVGLGNIWKFPYITGENGGGAFVLVYLACIFLIGVPVLIAEIMIGRRGGQSPVATMRTLTKTEGTSKGWRIIGWNGVVASFLVLSFYAVIGGWSLVYIGKAALGLFVGADAEAIGGQFNDLLANPWELLLWHTVFMAIVVFIVGRGIRKGLEKAVSMLMPMLFLLLIVMVFYAMSSGGFAAWFMGIGTVLSFNLWGDVHPLGFIGFFEGKTVFDLLDFLVSNVMMPLGGLAIALFAGWAIRREGLAEDIGLKGGANKAFMVILKLVTPAGITIVFLYNLI